MSPARPTRASGSSASGRASLPGSTSRRSSSTSTRPGAPTPTTFRALEPKHVVFGRLPAASGRLDTFATTAVGSPSQYNTFYGNLRLPLELGGRKPAEHAVPGEREDVQREQRRRARGEVGVHDRRRRLGHTGGRRRHGVLPRPGRAISTPSTSGRASSGGGPASRRRAASPATTPGPRRPSPATR